MAGEFDFEGLDDVEDTTAGAAAPDAPDTSAGAEPGKAGDAGADTSAAAKPDAKAADASTTPPDTAAKPNAAAKPDTGAPNPREFVPVATHIEERNQRRALQTENDRLKAELAALKNPPAKVDPPAEPDFAENPKGYVDQKFQSALEKLENAQKTTQQTAEQVAEQRFMAHLGETERQFVASTPDYIDALGHLRQIRATELLTLNPDLTQGQVIDIIRREELTLAANLVRSNRNPHEVAYTLAKARGYTPKAAAAAAPAQPNAASKPNGAAATPNLSHIPDPKQLPPDQTLGSGAGSPSVGEDVLTDDDAFDSAMSEVFGKRKRA